MTSETQKKNGYPLPDPVTGQDLICVKLMIPNDPTYIADFVGHLYMLSKWWNWEKSYTDGDTRATRAAQLWGNLLDTHLRIDECGDTKRTCTDYAPSSAIISYFPQDPFKDPDLVPSGYLLPPFVAVKSGDLINGFLGYVPGDVITTLSRIPLSGLGILILPTLGFPKIKMSFPTGGDLTLKLLSIESGGLARIFVDGVQAEEVDLEYLELQFPIQSTKEVEVTVTLAEGEAHTVEIRFDEKAMLSPPFVGFGGGLRSVTFCTEEVAKPQRTIYEELDTMPGIRVDCDCNVFITCPDGSEVQLAKLSDVPKSDTPQIGAAQPAIGGGSAGYCHHMPANGQFLLPTVVNDGDVIHIVSATGAGYDGSDPAWRCVDGQQFFAGACVGFAKTVGGDPVPTANHMSLVVSIDGTFYSLASGSVTVPSGVVAAQAIIQVNDAVLGDNQGSYDICVNVTNNQQATWRHVFDFKLSDGGFVQEVDLVGVWSAGIGWVGQFFGTGSKSEVYIKTTFPSTPLTRVEMTYSKSGGTGGNNGYVGGTGYNDGTFFSAFGSGIPDGTDLVQSWVGLLSAADISIAVNTGSGAGSCVISKLLVEGTGTDPFPFLV